MTGPRFRQITPRGPYSADECWIYTRAFGWLPRPGYQPLPPRPDRAIRFMRLLPDIRERM